MNNYLIYFFIANLNPNEKTIMENLLKKLQKQQLSLSNNDES